MTAQESICESLIKRFKSSIMCEDDVHIIFHDEKVLIVEALEKQMPKKPVRIKKRELLGNNLFQTISVTEFSIVAKIHKTINITSFDA